MMSPASVSAILRVVRCNRRQPSADSSRWIRFETPMDLELVGFLAAVAGKLAAAGVPIGAVCGYSRDHLFVSERHLPRALEVLRELFPASRDEA